VTVKKDGFESFQTTVTVAAGNKLRVEALLRPTPPNDTQAPDTSAAPPAVSEQDRQLPWPPAAGQRDEMPPFHLTAAAGIELWAEGIPASAQPGAAFSLGAGYRVVRLSDSAELDLDAKLGLSFVSESTGRDTVFSALANPIVILTAVPERLYLFGEVGAGVLVIAGVSPGSVFLQPGATKVTGALSTFEVRPGIGAAYALSPVVSLFLSPTLAWSPSPSPFFAESSIVRFEIAAGALCRL